jgi:hypothetical protein
MGTPPARASEPEPNYDAAVIFAFEQAPHSLAKLERTLNAPGSGGVENGEATYFAGIVY